MCLWWLLYLLNCPAIPFVWDEECKHAFDAAKSLLCSAPFLAVANIFLPCKLEVDAIACGASAVLLQDAEGDEQHSVLLLCCRGNCVKTLPTNMK